MSAVTFTPRFKKFTALIPMPQQEITCDLVKSFLEEQNFTIESVSTTNEGVICIKVTDQAHCVLLGKNMVLCVVDESHDLVCMAVQLLDMLYVSA